MMHGCEEHSYNTKRRGGSAHAATAAQASCIIPVRRLVLYATLARSCCLAELPCSHLDSKVSDQQQGALHMLLT